MLTGDIRESASERIGSEAPVVETNAPQQQKKRETPAWVTYKAPEPEPKEAPKPTTSPLWSRPSRSRRRRTTRSGERRASSSRPSPKKVSVKKGDMHSHRARRFQFAGLRPRRAEGRAGGVGRSSAASKV